jgi:hypothetical protein
VSSPCSEPSNLHCGSMVRTGLRSLPKRDIRWPLGSGATRVCSATALGYFRRKVITIPAVWKTCSRKMACLRACMSAFALRFPSATTAMQLRNVNGWQMVLLDYNPTFSKHTLDGSARSASCSVRDARHRTAHSVQKRSRPHEVMRGSLAAIPYRAAYLIGMPDNV